MSEYQNHPEQTTPAIDRDVLISRLVDGRAGQGDWSQLHQIADRDPGVWAEVREAQGAHERLLQAVMSASSCAESVSLNLGSGGTDVIGRVGGDGSGEASANLNLWRTRRAGVLGWGVAACLALAMTGQYFANRGRVAPGNQAGLGSVPTYTSPDQALDAYLELGKQSGKVVGEMPQKYVIKSQPATAEEGGGMEVLYVRQLIERAVVKDLYRLGTDELGRTVLVPAPPPAPPGEAPSPL